MSDFEQVLCDVSHHPWSSLMDEERDGMYAHYAAWERWMANSLENEGGDWDESDWFDADAGDLMERIDLFCAHCNEANALAKLEEKP